MPWLLLIAIGALVFAGMFYTRGSMASEPTRRSNAPETLDALFERFASLLPPLPVDGVALLKAIAYRESSMNPLAVRNNPPHDVSVGLMQVLCLPDENGVCKNTFNVNGWQGMTFDALKDPETNLSIATQILAYNVRTYGFPKGLAVYNAWSARHDPTDGPFRNQEYVDKVLTAMERYL